MRIFCVFCFCVSAFTCRADDVKLDVNDVSFLWPVPTSSDEVDRLVAADEPLDGNRGRIWADSSFRAVIAQAQATKVTNSAGRDNEIDFANFKGEFETPGAWKVVAFRVDPAAPGTSPKVTKAFGVVPQVRLILQPVTISNGKVKHHDVTAHLVFNFVLRFDAPPAGSRIPIGVPDVDKFRTIVQELLEMKTFLKDRGVDTNGKLAVHPGLKNSTEFLTRIRSFLKKHLADERLAAVAFMGLEPPEPWIFFAMAKKDGALQLSNQGPIGNKGVQMLTFRGGTAVMPEPTPRNIDGEKGVSTSILFQSDIAGRLTKPVFEGSDRPRHDDIPDLIANPHRATFFDTDCISCHTESSRRSILRLRAVDDTFAYRVPAGISGVDEALLPTSKWNVRNFGWFPSGGATVPTVTMRTANETADAAEYINKEYLAKTNIHK